MTFSFEPQIIKQDSAVPIRMIFGGWIVGVAAILLFDAVASSAIAIMGLTLLVGGLIALHLKGARMWRMVLGATTGAFATWIGFRFAFSERILPVASDPLELADRDLLGPVALGLCVFFIGVGAVLEAIRAQAAPGSSPIQVKVYLIFVGLVITAAVATTAGVSQTITLLLAVAAAVGLAAMAFLRNERPASDFVPQP